MNKKRIPLASVHNVRDLGGYPIGAKNMTRWGVFLRSADLSDITDCDRDKLFDYGIRTIINLKAVGESSNPIENDKRFCYRHIPLFDDFEKVVEFSKKYNGNGYWAIIKVYSPRIKAIFDLIANRLDDGGVLFHCFAGKDRTGIIAMLLLLLAGVSALDILADYMVSVIYVRPVVEKLHEPLRDIHIFPDEVEAIIKEIADNYKGMENFLKDIGVSSGDIEKIKRRFICSD